jgi:glycosyltransferase involved in cell wall biosynthesis
MSSRPRVIAVVPAYNPKTEDLLEALRSLVTQTEPVDICLVDDGSAPPVEVPAFARDRTHVLRLQRNCGITAALRAGVELARDRGYEFICRLDVGDVSYPSRVQQQLRRLDDNPGIDLVGGFARIIDATGRTLFFHGVDGGPAAVKAYLWKNAPFRHSTFLARTRALVELGSYDAAFDGAEDYELLLRLARTQRVDCVPEVVIDYVVDPGGISEARRTRQLRKRLKAQLRHCDIRDPAWYAGVIRTLVIMVTPRRLAMRATLWSWTRRSPKRTPPTLAGS